jgi:hypothetical protein
MTPDERKAWEELVDFVKEGFNASSAVVEGFSEAILAADLRIKRLSVENVALHDALKEVNKINKRLEGVAEWAREYVAMIEHPSTEFKTIDLSCDPVRVVNKLIAALAEVGK